MKQILIPFYDDYDKPTQILSYSLLNEFGHSRTFNVVDRKNTAYWRIPTVGIDEYLTQDIFIFDKKTFYKFTDTSYHNLIDVNTSLFHNGGGIVKLTVDNKTHINHVVNTVRNEVDFSKLTGISKNYDSLIRAESILDGVVTFGNTVVRKEYDHFTSGLRLRDISGQTLSMKKTLRETIRTRGLRIDIDMESFHLRILNVLIKGGIPNDIRAHDYILNEAGLDSEDGKKRIFSAMYSENFDSIRSEFFRRLKNKYMNIRSPFGRNHNNFNYKVQEYESYLMSRYIQKINVDYVDILLYLYDGIYVDLLDHTKLKDFIVHLRSNINLPFTVKIGNVEKRFFNG